MRRPLIILLVLMMSCEAVQDQSAASATAADTMVSPMTEITDPLSTNLPLGFEELVEYFENTEREEWQRPEMILDYFGSVEGKTIADIGAGSGYFSYRLLDRGANVIATEIDERFIKWLDDHVLEFDEEAQGRFETRLATASDMRLEDAELDGALLINTISYIADQRRYLRGLRSKIKPGGKLIIVDFKSKRIPVPAPELKNRSVLGKVEADLIEDGYKNLRVEDCGLEFQWILIAEP